MYLTPTSIQDARAFVDRHHRHHKAPLSGLFAVAVSEGESVVGVAIVGRPVARGNADGWTAKVTRVAVLEGHPNACSMLYGACRRAAFALGYRRVITYTLVSGPGSSVRGTGWKEIGRRGGGTWDTPSRPRVDTHPLEQKTRWEVVA
jgi:hypothetical protein